MKLARGPGYCTDRTVRYRAIERQIYRTKRAPDKPCIGTAGRIRRLRARTVFVEYRSVRIALHRRAAAGKSPVLEDAAAYKVGCARAAAMGRAVVRDDAVLDVLGLAVAFRSAKNASAGIQRGRHVGVFCRVVGVSASQGESLYMRVL